MSGIATGVSLLVLGFFTSQAAAGTDWEYMHPGTMDVCFTKIEKKECTIDQILDISAEYLGPDGLAQAKSECAANEMCKSVMDVSIALGFDNPGHQFLLCKSGADEVLPSVSADIYVKEPCSNTVPTLLSTTKDTSDYCFAKIANMTCTVDNIMDSSAAYLGLKGLDQAKEDCRADEICKSIVDVSLAFGFEKRANKFMLCKSGANEVLESPLADIYIKGECLTTGAHYPVPIPPTPMPGPGPMPIPGPLPPMPIPGPSPPMPGPGPMPMPPIPPTITGDTMGVCFAKMANKTCTIDNLIDISADYLGLDGFADAKRDCEADETCKSIVDVSKAFDLERGERFLLCKSGANEVEDYDSADVWVKEAPCTKPTPQLATTGTVDVPFRKMKYKRCPVWGIKEFSARYLGIEGFAQARRDCAADDSCKAIIDVSDIFHLGR